MSLLQQYNGHDTIATWQLWDDFRKRLDADPATAAQYAVEKAVMAPAMYAMTRGILVDQEIMAELRTKFEAENKAYEAVLDFITRGLKMGVINIASPQQKIWLFECLGAKIPHKYDPKVGKSRPTTDRDALEKIAKTDPELTPICNIIMAWQNRNKMLGVLQPELIDYDGRMRTGYKVASTVTDRWSSGKNCLWTGMNMQNVKRDEDEEEVGHASIRSMFVADPGFKFLNVDLKGADTWAVALEVFAVAGERLLLQALRTGDVHTQVAKMVWPDLGWTGDPAADKKIAEQFFYRQYDYRFMCKKGGHGSNYLGTPAALALQMKIAKYIAEIFQAKYFKAFPGIPKWQRQRIKELQTTATLTNRFGRTRRFHKRLDDNKTHKEAIAFLGQSVTAGTINRALIRVWAIQLTMPWLDIQFLAQVHDSLLIQFPEELEHVVVPIILEVMKVPISAVSPDGETETISIPLDAQTGWNWAKQGWNKELKKVTTNLDGLRDYKPGQPDERKRLKTPVVQKPRFMDRRLSGIYERC